MSEKKKKISGRTVFLIVWLAVIVLLIAAISALGLDPAFFPEVSPDVRALGEYRGIPVNIAIGDNQAAYYGVMPEGGVLCNFGTGSQVSVAVDGYREIPGLECRPYVDGRYILSVSTAKEEAACGAALLAVKENTNA